MGRKEAPGDRTVRRVEELREKMNAVQKECRDMRNEWKVVDITEEDGDPIAWATTDLVTLEKKWTLHGIQSQFDCVLTGEDLRI